MTNADEDSRYFIFTANAIPGQSLCTKLNPLEMETYERFNKEELRSSNFSGVPMHFEHKHERSKGVPMPHMGYVTSSIQEQDGGVSVMVEIPPVPQDRRSGVENSLRKEAIDLVKNGSFRDVSIQHSIDLQQIDERKVRVKKNILEVSLTTKGALEGSHVTGYTFLDQSVKPKVGWNQRPYVESVIEFPADTKLQIPKHVMASINSRNEQVKEKEASFVIMDTTKNTMNSVPVEVHLANQLAEKDRLLAEQTKLLAELPNLRFQASQYEAIVRKRNENLRKEYSDVYKECDEQALKILEENNYADDKEAAEVHQNIKKLLAAPAEESKVDFTQDVVSVPVNEFVNKFGAAGRLVFAHSFAKKMSMLRAATTAASSAGATLAGSASNVAATSASSSAAATSSVLPGATAMAAQGNAATTAADGHATSAVPDPTVRTVGSKSGPPAALNPLFDEGFGARKKRNIDYTVG